MGADMMGGNDRGLYTRKQCSEVAQWCEPFMPDRSHVPWDELMGVYDIPADVVAKADVAMPRDFDPAKSDLDEELWRGARNFLAETAAAGNGIHGSY